MYDKSRIGETVQVPAKDSGSATTSGYNPKKGEGKYKDIAFPEKVDEGMAADGKNLFEIKCSACHKLTDEKLVGPGWFGVTKKNEADWILNFITNTDDMIDKDPQAQAQLAVCMVRMPNQNLSDKDAKALYEFMRKNDGVK